MDYGNCIGSPKYIALESKVKHYSPHFFLLHAFLLIQSYADGNAL